MKTKLLGRTGIYEMMRISTPIRRLIQPDTDLSRLTEVALHGQVPALEVRYGHVEAGEAINVIHAGKDIRGAGRERIAQGQVIGIRAPAESLRNGEGELVAHGGADGVLQLAGVKDAVTSADNRSRAARRPPCKPEPRSKAVVLSGNQRRGQS